jgi:hypothetical protein
MAAGAMSAMHEHMYERTSKQEEPRDQAEHILMMVLPKQYDGHRGKSQEYEQYSLL